jgi:uncharacterized protein (DUF2252 family)
VPLEVLGEYEAGSGRPDPVSLLERQALTRVPELIPVRYGRMLTSPLAFYRGAAYLMASDLAPAPTAGLTVQLCGDAHLGNFGFFGSPERRLVFDLNDFDETLPGPFDWDVKRLAASFVVAGRLNGLSPKKRRRVVEAAAGGYREAMHGYARAGHLEVWYSSFDVEAMLAAAGPSMEAKDRKRSAAAVAKARSRDSHQALDKLTTQRDGRRRIVADPPLVLPIEDLVAGADAAYDQIREILQEYRSTLTPDRRHLLDRFELEQVAHKVVGVGSVGTRTFILLLMGRDDDDPLFLQAKEAGPSVLDEFLGPSEYPQAGERVVTGQRLMQASSDIFLGWHRIHDRQSGVDRDFYVRQLRDWKFSLDSERMKPSGMTLYARYCGMTLARAHARSGDRFALAGYLGDDDAFDQAMVRFGEAYADQNERDFAALAEAVRTSRVSAVLDL